MVRIHTCLFSLFLTLIFVIVGQAQDDFPELLNHQILVVEWDLSGNRYATGHADGEVNIYENDVLQRSIQTSHTKLLHSISFSPDGSRFVTGAYDNIVKIWSTSTGAMIIEFINITETLETVHWSKDGTTIVAMGLGEDQFFSADSINDIYTISLNTQIGSTYDIEYSPDNTLIAVSNSLADLLVLDGNNKNIIRRLDATPDTDLFDPPTEFTMNVAWHPTDNVVANGKINGWIHIWDLDSASDTIPLMSLQTNVGSSDNAVIPYEYTVRDITFDASGTTISSVSADGTFRTWNIQTGTLLLDVNLSERILSASFSSDGTQLSYSEVSGIVKIVDISSILCDMVDNDNNEDSILLVAGTYYSSTVSSEDCLHK